MQRPQITVTFYKIKENGAKIQLICHQAMEALQCEKKLLITAPTLEAAHYLDALLWRLPEDSFIPHVVSDMPTAEWVAITLQDEVNVNRASQNGQSTA